MKKEQKAKKLKNWNARKWTKTKQQIFKKKDLKKKEKEKETVLKMIDFKMKKRIRWRRWEKKKKTLRFSIQIRFVFCC